MPPERRFLFSPNPTVAWYEYETPDGDTVQEREPQTNDEYCKMTRIWSLGLGVTTHFLRAARSSVHNGAHSFAYRIDEEARNMGEIGGVVEYGHAVTAGGLEEMHNYLVAQLKANRWPEEKRTAMDSGGNEG